jgi:hypothetical protein
VLRLPRRVPGLSPCRPHYIVFVAKGFTVDEEQMQMAAMEQMMSGGMGGGASEDPFAMDSPPGYSMVMVPDAVLPAVMELVSQAESGGMGAGAAGGQPPMPMM